MRPIAHIRKDLFKLSQAAFGAVAGTSQATVSRWESGELEPSLEQIARIRSAAIQAGLQWRDELLFEPQEAAAIGQVGRRSHLRGAI
jgi:transcriptional regulator with XRE-family HTH domain